VWVKFNPSELSTVALSPDAKPMAENLYRALWAFLITVIVIYVVSMFTKAKPVSELDGLVYGATILPKEEPVPFYRNEYMWALLAVIIFAVLNILFW
jgi:SSS family solute:Na+ symporter